MEAKIFLHQHILDQNLDALDLFNQGVVEVDQSFFSKF
jgi:hypothetical protein